MKRTFSLAGLRQARSGSTAVEFALLLPACVLLLFGMVELGRLGFATATLDDAAQQGAQFASRRGPDSIAPATETEVKEYVLARVHGAPTSGVTVTVTWSPSGSIDRTVTVAAAYRFTFLASLLPIPAVALHATSTQTVL